MGCNDNFAKLIGRSHKDEVIGLTDYDFDWQPEDADAFRLADEKVLQFNVPQINQEEVVHHNGEELTMLVSKVPVHEANGSLLGLLGISTDISKLKETERKLQAANRVKAEFIANMSHDFRTPITGMIGMTQSLLLDAQKIESLLAQGGETDVNAIQTLITSVKSDGEMLLSATDQLLHLCTEVMSVASSDIHQQVSKTQPFLIADLLTHNVHLLKPALKKKQLTLKKVVDEALPKAIWGNKLYLERVILNLLSNAIKFTPQGEVRISLKASRHAATNLSTAERSFELVIVVEDTGLGIPEDKFEDIFSYFTRLHPTYEGQFSGFGLGLCHVKEYVTAMNGSIEVQSQLEAGSRFTVRVPVRSYLGAEMMQKELLSPLDCTVAAPPKPWSILLVEDSQIVAKALKVQLTTLGCAVSVSNTAAQALARVENEAFDLLFVDVGLPDFSGIELTKAIRNLSNPEQFSVPIIALTGHGGDEEIQKACLEAGMQQVLIKPASPQALQQTLAQYLQSEDL